MDEIRTAQWTETRHGLGEHPFSTRTEHWIRLDPPAHAWRDETVEGGSGWSHDVIDERGHLHTASNWTESALMRSPRPLTAEDLLRNVAAAKPRGDEPSQECEGRAERYHVGEWRVETIEENGLTLNRHSVETVHDNFGVSHLVWTEPDTGRMVRSERRERDLRTGTEVMVETATDFRFNVEISPDVFQMPADRPLVDHTDLDPWPRRGEPVPEKDQREALRAVEQCCAGWLSGDFRLFSAPWRFGTSEPAPTRADWKGLLDAHRGLWREFSCAPEKIEWWFGVVVQTGASTFTFSSREKTDVLRVEGTLEVAWADSGEEWRGRTTFYLRKRWGRWRIVHWELPLEQMKAAREERSA